MPTRVTASASPKQPQTNRKTRVPIIIWLSHCDKGTYVQVISPKEAVQVRFVEELYVPGDNSESWAMAEELAYLRLPGFWKKVYNSIDNRVVATHFIERRKPSEEVRIQEELEWLQKLEDFRKKFCTKEGK